MCDKTRSGPNGTPETDAEPVDLVPSMTKIALQRQPKILGGPLMQHRVTLTLLAAAAVSLTPSHSKALGSYLTQIPNSAEFSCGTCHDASPPNASNVNAFGTAFAGADHMWTMALADADSDGDGQTNGQELGDPCGVWTMNATPAFTTGLSNPGDDADENNIAACGEGGAGGMAGAAGMAGMAGEAGMAGMPGTGGTVATGGMTGTGGVVATGGTTATGGTPGVGGTGTGGTTGGGDDDDGCGCRVAGSDNNSKGFFLAAALGLLLLRRRPSR
jgi:MYXO-CTERM domain-containing protein